MDCITSVQILDMSDVAHHLVGFNCDKESNMAKAQQPTSGVVAKFLVAKETKGAVQYKEVDDKGQEIDFANAKIGTIYVRKSTFGSSFPKAIQVAVTW